MQKTAFVFLSSLLVYGLNCRGEWIVRTEPPNVPLAGVSQNGLVLTPLLNQEDGGETILAAAVSLESDSPEGAMAQSLPEVDPDGDLIGNLARQLEYNWTNIYLYVHNRIKTDPYVGLIRSPERTLLDGAGSPMEQAHLFSALIRSFNGVTGFGEITDETVPVQSDTEIDICDLTGIADYTNAFAVLDHGGLVISAPDLLTPDSRITLHRVLTGVKFDSGTWYYFEPSFKKHLQLSPVDLKAAMGYSRTDLLNAAGGTGTNYQVTSISESGVTNLLRSYSSNLLDSVYASGISVETLWPERHVTGDARPRFSGEAPPCNELQDLLPDFNGELVFSISNYDWKMKTYGVAHSKISIQFDDNVEFFLGDEFQVGVYDLPNPDQFDLPVSFVYAGTTNKEIYSLKRGGRYVFCQSFGAGCGSGMAGYISKNIEGLKGNEAAVFTESLRYAGQRWMDQITAATDASDVLTGMRRKMMYQFGMMAGTTNGFYIDVKQMETMGCAVSNRFLLSDGFVGSAMEHAVLEQMQPGRAAGASTIRVLNQANRIGTNIYRADSASWSSIKGALSGYSLSEKNQFQAQIDEGGVVILPQNRFIRINAWAGPGWVEYVPGYTGARLSMNIDGYDGGVNTYFIVFSPSVLQFCAAAENTLKHSLFSVPESKDPVDMQSGAFLFDHNDLTLDGPLPMTVHRSYRSDVTENTGMGKGWTHSFNIRIEEHSAIDPALGQRSVEDMVPFLAGMSVVQDLLDHESTAKDWVVASLVADWTTRQLTQNAVSVYLGGKVLTFVRQPDGRYSSPPGMTVTLSKTNGVYVMQERNSNTYTFNTSNRVAKIADPDGNTLKFTYNSLTNLTIVTNSFGPKLTFSYNSSNLLTSVKDNSSPIREIRYQYDAARRLISYEDAAGKDWDIAYGDFRHPYAITSLTDPENIVTIRNFYNNFGQVTNQLSATGKNYDLFITDWQSTERDPLGQRTSYLYDYKGRTAKTTKADGACITTSYDGWNRVTNTVNEAGITNVFVYDNHHNLLAQTNAVGTAQEVASHYGYDSLQRLVAVTNAWGSSEFQVSSFEYDSEHHLIKTIDPLGNETGFEYYPNGLIQTKTEGNGKRVTDYTYDTYGNPDTVVSTDAGTANYLYDIRGTLKEQKVNGIINKYYYDSRRLLTNAIYAFGTPEQSSESKTYYANGLLYTAKDRRGASVTNIWNKSYKLQKVRYPDGGIVSNTYDAADRLIAVKDPKGNISSNTLDAAGRVIAVSSAFSSVTNQFDSVGNLTNSVVDPSGLNLWRTMAYDPFSRLLNQQSAIGSRQFSYDALGRQTNTVDAASKVWKTQYDALGRAVASVRPTGATEQTGYNVLGYRTSFTNAEGKVISFGLDAQGRVTAITNAIGRVTRFTYDSNGNLTDRQNAKMENTHYDYSALNRLTNVVHEGVWKASFRYDGNGNIVTQASPLALSSFSYDSMNRLLTSTQSVYSVSSVVQNSYDLNGNRTNILYPGGLNVSYSYDAENRLSGVTTKYTNSTKTFAFGYDGASRLTNIVYPNTVVSKFGYDAESRVTNYTHGAFLSHSITRDPRGYKTREDIYSGLVPAFTNELHQTRSHNDADQLLSAGTEEYSYDSNGCLTNSDSAAYSYDYDNRLTSVSSVSSVVQYLYDASGARIGRIHNSVTNYFVVDYVDPLKRPLAEVNASGTVIRYYVWAGFRLLAHIEAGGMVRYYHQDELGSTLALSDSAGNVTDQFAYSPYGKLLSRTGTNSTAFQWLGGYGVFYDSVTDFHLTLHRAYSADMRRFISSDPSGIDGGVNLYAYGNLNPLAFVDPYGLCAESGSSSQIPRWENYTPGSSSPRTTQYNSAHYQANLALTLGASFRADSPLGDMMAQDNAFSYITAGSSAVLADDIARVAGKGIQYFRGAPRSTTILGENMAERVIPFAEETGARTLPFGTTADEWANMTARQRWKLNDGTLRARINEGDSFRYIGKEPRRLPSVRTQFDLTRSELLRLQNRSIPYEVVSPSEIQSVLGRP